LILMYFRRKTADYFRSNFSSIQTLILRFGYLWLDVVIRLLDVVSSLIQAFSSHSLDSTWRGMPFGDVTKLRAKSCEGDENAWVLETLQRPLWIHCMTSRDLYPKPWTEQREQLTRESGTARFLMFYHLCE